MFSREMVITHPESMLEIEKEAKATLELISRCKALATLRRYEDWGKFDWAFMCQWANKVDEPFVKLMISLAKHGYHYGAISMHRWWRRLKAVNQQNLISFFSYVGFTEKKDTIWWYDVYQQCCKTQEILQQMQAIYNDDSAVEMNLRAMLGCSQNADIKSAFHKFCLTNHPDKGGSAERFILVKAAYEEWQNAHIQ